MKKNIRKILNNESGQSLMEVLLAFGVSILIMGAIVSRVIASLDNAQYSKNQNLATTYAQEGLDIVRRIRDASWIDFENRVDGNYCLPSNTSNLAVYDGNECKTPALLLDNLFARKIEIYHSAADCADASGTIDGSLVIVTTSWPSGKCTNTAAVGPYCNKVQLDTCLLNIRAI